jgi:hypothetical protein
MADEIREFRAYVEFEKGAADPTGEYLRGWLSVSIDEHGNPVVDDQDDHVSTVELTKAAHRFVSDSRAGKVMHNGQPIGEWVESVMIDDDFAKAMGMSSKKRGWWGTFHVLSPEIRKRAASGEFKGFSIGGQGTRVTRKKKA